MIEQLKRGLRPKRPPKYRGSDEQDPDNASYFRPNYAKMTTHSLKPEYVSPSVELNQNAKLLVKFINKTNKDLKDYRLLREESEKELTKKDNPSKDKMSVEPIQNSKRQTSTTRNQKTQPPKKNKELYNFKGLHQNSDLMKNISQEQMLKGVKGMENLSGLMNNKGIYSGPLSNQLSQLQSLYPNLKDLNYQNLTQSPNPNLFQFNQQGNSNFGTKQPTSQQAQNASKPARQQSQKSRHDAQKSQPKQKEVKEPKKVRQVPTSQKIFKRSAYHVAIAYHIYLKGLYEQGIVSGNLLDPTYKARLIKEQAGMADVQQ